MVESYAYAHRGVGDVQVNILSRHNGHVAMIELDTEPTLVCRSQAELEAIGPHWRWREPYRPARAALESLSSCRILE